MLPRLLHSIADDLDWLPKHLWDFRISGNVVEIRVLSHHLTDPNGYRLGVIQSGRAIQEMESRVRETGRLLQVSSFPRLEEPRLIALLRLHRISETTGPVSSSDSGPDLETESLGQRITRVGDEAGFNIAPVSRLDDRVVRFTRISSASRDSKSHEPLGISELPKRGENGENSDGEGQNPEAHGLSSETGVSWYLLSTNTDHPFIWLRIGKWLQRILQMSMDAAEYDVRIFCELEGDERVTERPDDLSTPQFLQVLIQIDPQ